MKALFIEPDNTIALESALNTLELDSEIKSLLFLMADNQQLDNTTLKPLLSHISKPIIGGIFPELIFMGERKINGIILVPLNFELKTQLFKLSESIEELLAQIEKVQSDSVDISSSLFVFADSLSPNKESFIEMVFNFFGVNPTYIGGGTGSLNFKPFASIITNSGLHTNAAVIGWTKKRIALGVAHGWKAISSPLKVTKANRNQIESINWKPAFEVYKEIVELHSGLNFSDDNFFHIAKSYPLGIAKIDAEMVVRDPFKVIDNVIYTVDVVNEGEYVSILHGNTNSLLRGALNAKEIAISKVDEEMDVSSIFCIDCISRVLFMQDNFDKELKVIGHKKNVTGILTIGEIANSEESILEIYNKAIVVGIW